MLLQKLQVGPLELRNQILTRVLVSVQGTRTGRTSSWSSKKDPNLYILSTAAHHQVTVTRSGFPVPGSISGSDSFSGPDSVPGPDFVSDSYSVCGSDFVSDPDSVSGSDSVCGPDSFWSRSVSSLQQSAWELDGPQWCLAHLSSFLD